jgi:hypothetical protein
MSFIHYHQVNFPEHREVVNVLEDGVRSRDIDQVGLPFAPLDYFNSLLEILVKNLNVNEKIRSPSENF